MVAAVSADMERLAAEVERLKDLVCDREDSIIERDATIERMGKVGADAIALLTKERDEALALVADLQTGLVSSLTTGGRLRVQRDEARATIERLWAQLNEATNVPERGWCTCARCTHYRDVAASVAAKAKT